MGNDYETRRHSGGASSGRCAACRANWPDSTVLLIQWLGWMDPNTSPTRSYSERSVVHCLTFIGAAPAFIFGILKNVLDGQRIEGVPVLVGKALIIKSLGNVPDSHLLITPHHRGFHLVDGKHAILFVIASQFVIAQHMAVLMAWRTPNFNRAESFRTLS